MRGDLSGVFKAEVLACLDHRKKTLGCVFFLWSTNDDASRTSEILESLYLILINYEVFQKRVQKTKLLLQNIVKPDNFADTRFLM